jgi:hypothetical protein
MKLRYRDQPVKLYYQNYSIDAEVLRRASIGEPTTDAERQRRQAHDLRVIRRELAKKLTLAALSFAGGVSPGDIVEINGVEFEAQ